jgi:tetratricopeptide (TPR) repeat protein
MRPPGDDLASAGSAPIRFVISVVLAWLVLSGPSAAQEDFTTEQTRLLTGAEATLSEKSTDADALIWKGRRLGYLGRYEEAIAVYAAGEALHPTDARFARHIGHRLISLQRFAEAETALTRAAALTAALPDETEPDGLPNAAGVPTSTLKGNIWYHLGLAHYLQGEFDAAARAFEGAAALSANPDAASAAIYWLYLSLKRAGDDAAAAKALARVDASWALIENGVYHDLALCFRGEKDCDAILARAREAEGVDYATSAYGVAMQRLISGDRKGARALLKEIIARDGSAAFGRLAAEAEFAR